MANFGGKDPDFHQIELHGFSTLKDPTSRGFSRMTFSFHLIPKEPIFGGRGISEA
jgi:hypothetical protein